MRELPQHDRLATALAGDGRRAPDAESWKKLDEVRAQIPDDAVLIEFCEVPKLDWSRGLENQKIGQHIVAWVIPPAGQGPAGSLLAFGGGCNRPLAAGVPVS